MNNLLGIQVIKSFMTYDLEKESLKSKSRDYQMANIDAIAISSAFNPLIRMGVLAGFLGTILIGSYMALNGTIEVGSYSVLVFLTQRFLWPFTSLSTLIDDFERSMASCARIFNMMHMKIKIINKENAIKPIDLSYDIKFTNISFRYSIFSIVASRFLTIFSYQSFISLSSHKIFVHIKCSIVFSISIFD